MAHIDHSPEMTAIARAVQHLSDWGATEDWTFYDLLAVLEAGDPALYRMAVTSLAHAPAILETRATLAVAG